MNRPAPHGIDRAEWVERFTRRLGGRLDLSPLELEHIAPAELESWPETPGQGDSDWRDDEPESAADENLSYWTE